MKKIIFFLAFLLAACSGAPTATSADVDIYGTSAAAQVALEHSQLAMTGTAQAQVIPITYTAAAWEQGQRETQAAQIAQMSTETAALTGTAISWTATPNATSTMVAERLIAEQARIENDMRTNDLKVQRAESTNMIYAALPFVIVICVLIVAVMAGIAAAMRISKIAVPIDQRGNPQPMFDVINGEVTDALPERLQITANIAQRLPHVAQPTLSAPVSEVKLERPGWSIADQWQGGADLPYGLTANGLGLMNMNLYPHSAAIGKTGSGKSRRFMRPVITFALAAGQQVVIMGKSVDFLPFLGHPNCTIIPVRELTMEQEAQKYAMFLKSMVEEMNRRDEYLTARRASTWSQAGRESTLVVLDEFGNALDMMPREFAEQSMRYTRGLVKEGRKVGFHLMIASQRVKGLRDVITQMGRAVFFVEDEQESRYALGTPGAEQLHEGYFYSKFGAQQLTGAFEPTDDEIAEFLRKRSVSKVDEPGWELSSMDFGTDKRIEADEVPLIVPTAGSHSIPDLEPASTETQRMAEGIRSQWFIGMSKSAVSRLLGYPQYGGSYKAKTDAVVEYLNSTTTTAQKAAEMPVLGLVGA